MVTVSGAEQASVMQTFVDTDGVSHDVASITSMYRSSTSNSVMIDSEGGAVTVEIANTEAMRIIELLN